MPATAVDSALSVTVLVQEVEVFNVVPLSDKSILFFQQQELDAVPVYLTAFISHRLWILSFLHLAFSLFFTPRFIYIMASMLLIFYIIYNFCTFYQLTDISIIFLVWILNKRKKKAIR